MNKKFLSAILFGALMVTSTGTFVSCKDYDDDIKDLQGQIDKKASVEEMTTKLANIQTALDEAKATSATAKTTAEEALAKAKAANDAAAAAKAEAELMAIQAKEAAIKAAEAKVAELKAELEAKVDAKLEELQKLEAKVDALVAEVSNLVGHRLTSIAFIPKTNINGIPAMNLVTLQYTPQVYQKLGDHDAAIGGMFDHKNATSDAKAVIVSSDSTMVYYRLNPSMGLRSTDIELPSFDCIVANNISRGVADSAAFNNSPIMPVAGQEINIKDGVLSLRIKKNTVENIGHDGSAAAAGGENFYMASLKVPVAKANWTDDEAKAVEAGTMKGVYVNSEYVRIEETVLKPYILNSKAGAITSGTAFADEQDVKGNYVHYHDSICLYKSSNNVMVDIPAVYNQPLDLKKYVTVCGIVPEAASHSAHQVISNYKTYGLEYRFELATAKYMQGIYETNEQEFATIDNAANGIMTSRVYSVGGSGDSKASVGREPIVRISLVDTNNGNALVAQRYLKVRWIKEQIEPQTLDPYAFKNDTISCHDMFQQLGTQAMNEVIYHKVKVVTENSSASTTSISKEDFHNIYKNIEIISLKKDGKVIDLETIHTTTAEADWDFINGTTGAKEIKNITTPNVARKAVLFAFLEDTKVGNSTYNLLWSMTPELVGTINGRSSKFEITVQYQDPTKAHGAVQQTFTQNIIVPAQQFTYQGTYWKDAIGSGTFKVNPIVYKSDVHGAVDTNNMSASSHISADLVNGYVYSKTSKKPVNISELIKHKYGADCTNASIVFDQAKFKDYEHLAAYYTATADSSILWMGTIDEETGELVKDEAAADNLAARIVDLASIDNGAATSTIQLREKDGITVWPSFTDNALRGNFGTDAANNLIGKAVPVKLVVKYNEMNIITEDDFEILFIEPLKVDNKINDKFVDAVVNGSFVDVATKFTMTDWNNYTVAQATAAGAKDKAAYAAELYKYYNVTEVAWDVEHVKTNLKLVDNVYVPQKDMKDGELPTDASLKAYTSVTFDAAGRPTASNEALNGINAKYLAYFNNNGTPVDGAYKIYVPVKVTYKWGVVNDSVIEITVDPAEGTNKK